MGPKFVCPIFLSLAFVFAWSTSTANAAIAAGRKLVMVAGAPSHPPGMHEYRAGCLLLKRCLDAVPGLQTVLHTNGWPEDPKTFEGADAIFFYMDGGKRHAAIEPQRLKALGELMKKGVGLGCAHFAVEVPKDQGGPEFLDWIGGYYDVGYSINPTWTAEVASLPDHAVTHGVKAFAVNDEWYFNIRFRSDPKGVIPILISTPSDEVRQKSYGPYPHIVEARGRAEVLMWITERPDGGRGFGFTGGHFHRNWGEDNFRKLVLNALLWIAKVEVPAAGVECAVSAEQLKENLDSKPEK